MRIVLMNGLESEAVRFSHATARMMNGDLRLPLAKIRRVEHHQQTMVNWLLPADLSPLETTIAFEQVAIEVTASVALREPDDYMAQVYRFGLLEDFDHLYRFSALMDRVAGGDANNIIQNYTDIIPGRPTSVEHRAPEDDLREHYVSATADPLTKLHAIKTIGEVTEPARVVMGRAGTAIAETGRSAGDVIWRNPIPVALIGLGLGMIAMRSFRRGNGYDYDDMKRSSSPRVRRQSVTTGGETEYDYGWDRTQHSSGSLNRVKETASDLAHRSTDAISHLGSKAKDTASSLGARCEQMLRQNPIACGVVAVAAGTAVGLMLPTSRFENKYIGENGRGLMDKAQEVAGGDR